MARQVITVLTDDLDGADADRTIEFGLDGVTYTIDLSE
ncbi:MAG: Protein lsr2, partial [Actinomycetia bacterium]|nr:Protein lsr2 [Actinomycetes bacterium]